MRWTETLWFKHLCTVIVCIFISQSVQPMTYGFTPHRPPAVSTTARDIQPNFPKHQVSSTMERVKRRLQELEVLSNIEDLMPKQVSETPNCKVSNSELEGSATTLDQPSFFPLENKRKVKQVSAKREDLSKTWFDWLTSLFVSEVHAQISDPNLESTLDANTNDPFIVQKAQELGNDANQIFAFVRDEIGYESYRGSLRGARGTLWSNAGNALDQASLLVALLRASEIPARYVHGTLPDVTSQQLILTMFPNPTRIVGCPPDDVERADPANDPQLLAETREHYWVELNIGGGFTPADPTVPNSQLGDTFAVSEGTFSEVTDALRHKVAVRLNVEFNNSLTGGLQDPKTVLNEAFNTVELVGHHLSVGHFVKTKIAGGAVFTTTTHTYSPYILMSEYGRDITEDELIRGQDYQELFSNLAFSTTFLTGVFLETDVVEPEDETGQRDVETHDISRNKPRCSGCIKSSNDPKHTRIPRTY